MLSSKGRHLKENVEPVTAHGTGNAEAPGNLVDPALFVPNGGRGIHEEFEGSGNTAHVGWGAEYDGIGGFQSAPVRIFILADRHKGNGHAIFAGTTRDRMCQRLGVSVGGKEGDCHQNVF